MGLAGIAVSLLPNGPFDFVRSFHPDGNLTRDQTLFPTADGGALLGRTYYATTEFILPAAVMQVS